MLALEVCATARHTAGGLRARTERVVRLTYESAVLSSIGYPGGLHRIAVRPTTFPCSILNNLFLRIKRITHVRTHTQTHTHTYTHVRTHTITYTNTHVRTHAITYTNMHTHIHTEIFFK